MVAISLMILSVFTQISGCDSLQNLVTHYCGSFWGVLTTVCTLLYSFGACVTYLIVIADQSDNSECCTCLFEVSNFFKTVFLTFYGSDFASKWYMNRGYVIFMVAILLVLPLCAFKDISFLKFSSFIGFCSTTYITFLVFIEYLKHDQSLPPHYASIHKSSLSNSNWTSIFYLTSVLTFSYQVSVS